MKKLSALGIAIFVFTCLSVLQSCKQQIKHRITFEGKALGTFYTIHIYHHDDSQAFQNSIQLSVDSLLKNFNSVASIYDSLSIISMINNNREYKPDPMFDTIFIRASEISEMTDGAFDITVGPLVNAWGFGFTDSAHITDAFIDSVLQFTGYMKVRLKNSRIEKDDDRIMLDMNAIAKGYAVDLVSLFLESKGIDSYIVEIGGEVRAGSAKPDGSKWITAVEKPAETAIDPQQEESRIYIEKLSVATSGTYRRYYERGGERFSHTIDPKTGRPVSHNMLSVTVIARDCMTADALATACMVLGLEEAMRLCESIEETEAYFIVAGKEQTYKTYQTNGFSKYFQP